MPISSYSCPKHSRCSFRISYERTYSLSTTWWTRRFTRWRGIWTWGWRRRWRRSKSSSTVQFRSSNTTGYPSFGPKPKFPNDSPKNGLRSQFFTAIHVPITVNTTRNIPGYPIKSRYFDGSDFGSRSNVRHWWWRRTARCRWWSTATRRTAPSR